MSYFAEKCRGRSDPEATASPARFKCFEYCQMDTKEHNQLIAIRRKASMETDFEPNHTPERMPSPDVLSAIALEYIAYQLGQINRKMDKLNASSHPSATQLQDEIDLLNKL